MSRSRRTQVHTIRLTPGERARLRARAYLAGVSPGRYLRERPLAQRMRSRRSRLRPADVDRLAQLGTDLNRFARAANTARYLVGPNGLGELLERIRSAAGDLVAKLRP